VRFELPEQSKLIVCHRGKSPFAQGVAILRQKPNFTFADRVVNHVQNETEKSIDKVFPSPMLSSQATF